MFLQVTFNDGSTLDVGLSNSHTVQVLSPQNTIDNAFAVSGVKTIELVDGEPPAPEPEAQPVDEAAPAVTDAAAAEDAAATTDTAAVEETAPVDPPPAAPSSTESNTTSSEPQTTSTDTPADDPAHDQAVAQVADAIQTVTDAKPKEQGELVALVQADIDSALAQWPDSPQLLDARQQLGLLATRAA